MLLKAAAVRCTFKSSCLGVLSRVILKSSPAPHHTAQPSHTVAPNSFKRVSCPHNHDQDEMSDRHKCGVSLGDFHQKKLTRPLWEESDNWGETEQVRAPCHVALFWLIIYSSWSCFTVVVANS